MLLKDLQTLATKLATGTLFHVEKAGKAYSVDYSALAKAIIEEYADSTVGGSKQSVQAAIGALNSRIIYDPMALSASGSVLGYLNKLSNGVRAYVHTWQTISDMPSGLTETAYVFQFVTDAGNRVYDYVILTRIDSGEQWLGKVSDTNLSTRTLSWIKFPSRAEVDALNARVSALEGK